MNIKWVDKRKKKSLSKRLVPLVLICIFTFTTIAIYVQVTTGIELSPTLTTCFFSFCTGELWCLSSIKKIKLRHSDGYRVHDRDKHTFSRIMSTSDESNISDEINNDNEGAKG